MSMLKTVREYMELRATMRKVDIPGLSSSDVTFDGVVSSDKYQSIIANAKVGSGCLPAVAAAESRHVTVNSTKVIATLRTT